mmetsp:Transcript_24750/g.57366  ORF Transcript_24750/g.57366 Transcript_24750/m.57366 type:complete len:300 (-) Transcript_24750:401-1300(-)
MSATKPRTPSPRSPPPPPPRRPRRGAGRLAGSHRRTGWRGWAGGGGASPPRQPPTARWDPPRSWPAPGTHTACAAAGPARGSAPPGWARPPCPPRRCCCSTQGSLPHSPPPPPPRPPAARTHGSAARRTRSPRGTPSTARGSAPSRSPPAPAAPRGAGGAWRPRTKGCCPSCSWRGPESSQRCLSGSPPPSCPAAAPCRGWWGACRRTPGAGWSSTRTRWRLRHPDTAGSRRPRRTRTCRRARRAAAGSSPVQPSPAPGARPAGVGRPAPRPPRALWYPQRPTATLPALCPSATAPAAP